MHISTLLHIYIAKIDSKQQINQVKDKIQAECLIIVNVYFTFFRQKYDKCHILVSICLSMCYKIYLKRK